MPAKIHQFPDTGPRGGTVYMFHCPGCAHGHPFEVGGVDGWTWNGSLEKPTFYPSLMVNRGSPTQCHSFVTDGQIQFLGDSHHSLKGQTVELPDWDE
jgi:uncharacterized protein DUF6527